MSNIAIDNPFLEDLDIKDSRKITKIANAPHLKLVDTSLHKEVRTTPVVYAKEEVNDKTPFVKLYSSNIFTLFLNLSKRASAILAYIFSRLEYNKDYVVLDHEDFQNSVGDILGIKPDTGGYHMALKELEQKQVIAKRKSEVYWINPSMFYYGERRYLILKTKSKR